MWLYLLLAAERNDLLMLEIPKIMSRVTVAMNQRGLEVNFAKSKTEVTPTALKMKGSSYWRRIPLVGIFTGKQAHFLPTLTNGSLGHTLDAEKLRTCPHDNRNISQASSVPCGSEFRLQVVQTPSGPASLLRPKESKNMCVLTLGLQMHSKVFWGVFRGLNTF